MIYLCVILFHPNLIIFLLLMCYAFIKRMRYYVFHSHFFLRIHYFVGREQIIINNIILTWTLFTFRWCNMKNSWSGELARMVRSWVIFFFLIKK